MPENVDLICVWSHAVSVGIYMVGYTWWNNMQGCKFKLSTYICFWLMKIQVLGSFCLYIMQVYLYTCLYGLHSP